MFSNYVSASISPRLMPSEYKLRVPGCTNLQIQVWSCAVHLKTWWLHGAMHSPAYAVCSPPPGAGCLSPSFQSFQGALSNPSYLWALAKICLQVSLPATWQPSTLLHRCDTIFRLYVGLHGVLFFNICDAASSAQRLKTSPCISLL